MKNILSLTIALLLVSLIAACSPQAGSYAPATAPTLAAAPATSASAPTQAAASPENAATITTESSSCSYAGPQTWHASDPLAVTWDVHGTSGEIYRLLPFITDNAQTREELLLALKGLKPERPVFPAELTPAGASQAPGNKRVNVAIKTASGPMHGLLYFACSDLDRVYDVVGPVEIN